MAAEMPPAVPQLASSETVAFIMDYAKNAAISVPKAATVTTATAPWTMVIFPYRSTTPSSRASVGSYSVFSSENLKFYCNFILVGCCLKIWKYVETPPSSTKFSVVAIGIEF